jgi:hypothetical protein
MNDHETMPNQQRHHQQSESAEIAIEREVPAEPYAAVPVRVVGVVETSTGADQFGIYQTFTIPASSAAAIVPSFEQVLARDPLREYAYILPIDGAAIVTTSLENLSTPNNIGTLNLPQGAWIPQGVTTPPIRHNDPVWVANPSTSAPLHVSVLVERGTSE